MRGVDPWAVGGCGGGIGEAADEGAGEEDLGEFGAGVEGVGAEVGVDFGNAAREGYGGEGGAVQVGGLEDEAGVGGFLEGGQEGEGEEHLREVIYLEVGVW